jgi:hypothetical protein
MASYAYDNLDIDLKHSVPTIEKGQETLIHLTTGTMLPLHDVPPTLSTARKRCGRDQNLTPMLKTSVGEVWFETDSNSV